MMSFEHRNNIYGTAAAGNVKGTFRNTRNMFVFHIQPTRNGAVLDNWIENKVLLYWISAKNPIQN